MKPKEVPKIIVDIHEKESGLFEDIYARNIGDCTEEYLISGDVAISYGDKSLGIEVKRESDYENSLYSGRLTNQIVNMAEVYDMSFLIVENWHPHFIDFDEKVIADKVRRHELSIRTLNRRVICYETKNQIETLDLIEEIIKDLVSGKLFQMKRKAINVLSDSPSVSFIASLPNVGVERARLILEKFRCPLDALNNIDAWEEVPGITSKRVDEIKKILQA
jgi:ERCC4-type nuclease